jgi:hypothetical protein
MTTANKKDLKEHLARYRQIKLSVIGRKTRIHQFGLTRGERKQSSERRPSRMRNP